MPGANRWASTYYWNAPFANSTYEARLWRNGSVTSNALVVRGNPSSLAGSGEWTNEYRFQYSRNGHFSVWKTVNGTPSAVRSWSFTSAINQGSAWNTLRATASGTTLSFAINGTTLWTGSDSSFSAGYAGVEFFVDGSSGNQLWVDYARVVTPWSAAPEASAAPSASAESATGPGDPSRAPGSSPAAQSAPEGASASKAGTALPSSTAPEASREAPPSVVVAPPV